MGVERPEGSEVRMGRRAVEGRSHSKWDSVVKRVCQ